MQYIENFLSWVFQTTNILLNNFVHSAESFDVILPKFLWIIASILL